MNSYSSELFPTQYRGTAYAWANNLLGRLGYVVSPVIVGLLVSETGAYGPIVASTAIFNLVAIALVYRLLPETKSMELEESSAVEDDTPSAF